MELACNGECVNEIYEDRNKNMVNLITCVNDDSKNYKDELQQYLAEDGQETILKIINIKSPAIKRILMW